MSRLSPPPLPILAFKWNPDLRRMPVAVLSADATPDHIRRLKASGAVAYLTKPLDIRRVLQLIYERLRPELVT